MTDDAGRMNDTILEKGAIGHARGADIYVAFAERAFDDLPTAYQERLGELREQYAPVLGGLSAGDVDVRDTSETYEQALAAFNDARGLWVDVLSEYDLGFDIEDIDVDPEDLVGPGDDTGYETRTGKACGGCGGDFPFDVGDIKELMDHWKDDEEDRRRRERGKSIGVSVDVHNAEDAEATSGDPFSPSYSMSITADAETQQEAMDYLDQELEQADRLVIEGYNWMEGEVEKLVDAAWDDVRDGFRKTGMTSVSFPAMHRLADWSIDGEGVYSIGASVVKGDGTGYSGQSSHFGVREPEGDGTGLGLSVVTMEDAEFTTGINRTAAPEYLVTLDRGDMGEEEYRETVRAYLENDFEGLAVEWGEAEDVWELDGGLFPVMGETQARTVDPADRPPTYFNDMIADAYMDDAYVEEGWLYHPGLGQFVLPDPVQVEFTDGEQLGMRVSALDRLEAGEGPGYDHAAWTDVDEFGLLDFAGTVLGAADWIDKGMPLGEAEEEEKPRSQGEWSRLKGRARQRFGGRFRQFIGDVPDHYITDLLERHTFLGRFVGEQG